MEEVRKLMTEYGLRGVQEEKRPWGTFVVVDETQIEIFQRLFFSTCSMEFSKERMTPKFLVVEPHQRLSWQYHERRSELWRVLEPVGVMISPDDEEREVVRHERGSLIILSPRERHRLVGLDTVGVVAEIWKHVDQEHPSTEEDIVRVQDDFGRRKK
jgi:mannose-6-phosphate isomerase-like protein (cupin superfamily)